ncbi:MAG: hypothetical protein ABSE85_01925 [Candidatus Korobacteraceae bacterium]|jgi:hypothetical protein
MTQYLYRNSGRWAIATLLALWSLVAFSGAQIRDRTQHSDQQPSQTQSTEKKKTQRGPRAIAVLEFLPGGGARLVPVALWIDDRFYDASLYGANPEPMALLPETVYEATDYGEPTGLFTVTTPEQVKGSWVGTGRWKPELPFDKKLAQQAAKQPKPKPIDDPADDRPVLHRAAGSSGSSGSDTSSNSGSSQTAPSGSTNPSGGNTAPSPDEPSDRPTLKKPSSETSAAPPDTAASSTSPSPNAASPAATSSPDESDPNRPTLRRGKPATSATTPESKPFSAAQSTAPATPQSQPKLIAALNSVGRHSYPAVSDATPHEGRSLLYPMNTNERSDKSEQLTALAMDEIRKFIAQRKTPALPKNAAITDYDLRAFDLEFSNSPTFVLTATLPVVTVKALGGGAFNYFVTFVAHEDINGRPIKIFSSVTDSNHLDSFARMEIIDALDADANGRGDLLFRQYSDVAISYSLYRVYPYEMKKVFEGGSGS